MCDGRSVEELESDELEYLSRVLFVCREIGDFEIECTIVSLTFHGKSSTNQTTLLFPKTHCQ